MAAPSTTTEADIERCDGCNEPFEREDLTYCTECCYDLCEGCFEGPSSLDGRHDESCQQEDE